MSSISVTTLEFEIKRIANFIIDDLRHELDKSLQFNIEKDEQEILLDTLISKTIEEKKGGE